MPNIQRLEFVTSHFKDLQTIRFAPVPVGMLLFPAVARIPHICGRIDLALSAIFVFCVIGFYCWSTAAIERRYGSVKLARSEVLRRQNHPVIAALYLIVFATLLWYRFFAPGTHHADLFGMVVVLTMFLQRILDSANPTQRRVVWAIALVALFGGGAILTDVDGGRAIFALGGAVWLSLSLYDFLLLRRIFAGIAASPSSGTSEEGVAQFG